MATSSLSTRKNATNSQWFVRLLDLTFSVLFELKVLHTSSYQGREELVEAICEFVVFLVERHFLGIESLEGLWDMGQELVPV
jgi:hypothetical protein